MNPDVARRSHAVLMKAVELEGDERESYVNTACAGDSVLRAHVASLLSAMTRSGAFLSVPALENGRTTKHNASAAVPDRIRGYRIVGTIGVGGMATVYEAMQEQPRRQVALKVLRHGLARTSAVERFRFETEVLARLQHPGIAQIFEAGAYEDGHGVSMPFFVMEYVADATTITDYARRRGSALRERLELFVTVCDAVQHGHQHGVIHRDLKPGNILVDARGMVKVIDFGVARSIEAGEASSFRDGGAGQLVGTLNYMSPEQCSGAADIDIRTDVYSLGVILYELLCGRLPHDVSRLPVADALRAIRAEVPARPRDIDERLRGDLDAIVSRAIDKSPARRYATVAALAADIRRHLQHDVVEARPPTVAYRASRFVRRHRILIAASSLVVLAILVGALVSGNFAYQTWRESQRRLEAERVAIDERDAARWQSYVAGIAAAFASLQVHEYSHARSRLAQVPHEHRGWEWRFLDALVERSDRTIRAHNDMIFAFDVSPDASRLATGCRDGTLRVWDARTGTLLANCDGTPGSFTHAVAFSPDGSCIVSGSEDRSVRVWDSIDGRELRRLGDHGDSVRSVAWGLNGQIISSSNDGICRVWDVETGELVRTLDDQPGGIHGVLFNATRTSLATWGRNGPIWIRDPSDFRVIHRLPFDTLLVHVAMNSDGMRIAAGGAEGRLHIWDGTTGALLHDLTDPGNPSTVRTVAFTRDGRHLAAGHVARSIITYSLDDAAPPRRLLGHEEAVSGLAFTPDGRRLLSTSWDGTIRWWDISAADGADMAVELRGHENHLLAVTFSGDGSLLASGGRDDTIRLWDPVNLRELTTLCGHTQAVAGLAFSPDSTQLASASYDASIRIWNPATGACEDILTGHSGSVWSVAFSPDGRKLASSGDDGLVRIWDVASRRLLHTLAGHSSRVIQVAFSPDGALLASSSRDETVRIWDVETGAAVHELIGHQADVFAVIFSQDGRTLFSGARDQRVRVWDVESGDCRDVLVGHGQFVTCLALHADGSRLAAGSWFGEIVLWDLPTLNLVASFKGDTRPIRSIAFSPDGRWLAAGTYHNAVRLFDGAPRQSESNLVNAAIAPVSPDTGARD